MKLVLGTVSFGLDGYSLPNAGKPKPTTNDILKMIAYAKLKGINFLDTANAYGDAEDILGLYGASQFKITSKLKPNCLDNISEADIYNKIRQELENDLTRLNISSIWGYCFHTPDRKSVV